MAVFLDSVLPATAAALASAALAGSAKAHGKK
jgi:hypothetical protein